MDSSLILGKYQIRERLGSGAYGIIYRATEGPDDNTKQYAVKLERASKKRKRNPLEHEADVIKILSNARDGQCIPAFIDYGYHKGRHSKVLVMDLLGTDLDSLRRQNKSRFKIKTVLKLGVELISAIQYIHSQHFLHRDIKPGNILLGAQGSENKVYLVDFGLARRYRNPRNGVHQPFIEGKTTVGTISFASLNTHLGIAQTRRDDIESLAYSILDCLRELPWASVRGGSPKQSEDRVREKKRSWTPERLCAGLPDVFRVLLSHARQLKYDEEPAYELLRTSFLEEMERRGYSLESPFDWSVDGSAEDFAPPFDKPPRIPTEPLPSPDRGYHWVQPGDFIKLKLLGPPTVQFSGAFDSVETDTSFWQPPSLNGTQWTFPYRPAIVASVERNVVIRRGKRGIRLSVYPIIAKRQGLDQLPEDMRRRFIPLSNDTRTPDILPEWTSPNAYVYNTCVTLTVSVDPSLSSAPASFANHWHLKNSEELTKLTEQLKLVRPPLESGQPVLPIDHDETIDIKRGKRHILQAVFGEIVPLTPADIDDPELAWEGRNGWLKEYNQIGERLVAEQGERDSDSSEPYDSDFIYDSISPPGERRASCTVNLDACDFE